MQPWSTSAVTPSFQQIAGCPVQSRIGQYNETPRPQPWIWNKFHYDFSKSSFHKRNDWSLISTIWNGNWTLKFTNLVSYWIWTEFSRCCWCCSVHLVCSEMKLQLFLVSDMPTTIDIVPLCSNFLNCAQVSDLNHFSVFLNRRNNSNQT